MSRAEELLMKQAQREDILLQEEEKWNAHLHKDGLWKCEDRMKYASSLLLTYLPTDNRIIQLLSLNNHEELSHAGISSVLAQTRKTYWVPRGRQATK